MPPRLARLLAIIVAVGLVAGAFFLRGRVAGDDDGGSDTSGERPGGDDEEPSAGFRVLCDEDLGAACDAVRALDGVDREAFDVLPAGEAVEAMSTGVGAFDAWVTLDPLPGVLDAAAGSPVAGDGSVALASSDVAVLTYDDDRLGCAAATDWTCLATAAGGNDVGLPDLDTATGIAVLGHAAVGLLGKADFGIGEVRNAEETVDQLDALLESGAPRPTADQVDTLLVQQGSYDAAVTTLALARQQASTTRGEAGGLVAVELGPPATLGVVLAPIGAGGERAVDRLKGDITGQTVRDALSEAGWADDPAPSSGLPDPDVLYALQQEFR